MLRKLLLLTLLAITLVACGGNTANTENAAANTTNNEAMANDEMANNETMSNNEAMNDEAMNDNEAMADDEMMDEEAMNDNETMAEDETMAEHDDEAMAEDEAMTDDETMAEDEMMDEEMMHDFFSQEAKSYNLVKGWYGEQEVIYYDFGANTHASANGLEVITAPIYVLVTGFDESGNPQVVDGQRNIIDVVPGDEGYSDLWEVTFVTVPTDYEANTITSAQEILEAGYELTVPGIYVNCPVVPTGSTLENPDDASLVTGWYKGQEVSYFDFGVNDPITAPIYAFITGFDDAGSPLFVEGQSNVIGVVPGDEGYSAFWYVNLVIVPEDYVANTITSFDQVDSTMYEIVQPGLLVNCPVIPGQ